MTLNIDVNHLPPTSLAKVMYRCDYCNKIKYKAYYNYVKCTLKGIIKKDACDNRQCQRIKASESNLKVYGTKSTNSLPHVINKKKQSLLLPFSTVESLFKSRGYELISKDYINSNTKLKYICPSHRHEGIQKITYAKLKFGRGCYHCFISRISGENHYNWSGGESSLSSYLRCRLYDWTYNSLKKNNYKCYISGTKKDLEVHHLHNFNNIIYESLNELNLEMRKNYTLYTQTELRQLVKVCRKLHYRYGLGVPLSKEIHREFHSIYGKKNNNNEQFLEFCKTQGAC